MTSFPICFQDLEFNHRYVEHPGADGFTRHTWMSFGMPRLKPQMLQSVFYLYRPGQNGTHDGPMGTGIFVTRKNQKWGAKYSVYGVTAHHVAVSVGATSIRLNVIIGSDGEPIAGGDPTRFIDLDLDDWKFLDDDIAVADLTDHVGILLDMFHPVEESEFVTKDFIGDFALGPGDDGFMLGMFLEQYGGDANTPATRFGNLSLLSDETNPVPMGRRDALGNYIRRPGHVFDMHSRPGFSGSPVFVYRTPANALTGIDDRTGSWNLDTTNNVFLRLLGVHSGQFDERVTALAAGAGDHNKRLMIPSSMTTIVPAWRITEVLEMPELKKKREDREERQSAHARSRRTSFSAEATEAAPESDNPAHKEDFTSLLNEAARTPPQDD